MSLTDVVQTQDPVCGKLGRAGVKKDPRTFRLTRYTAEASNPPVEAHHSHVVQNWGMLLNDQLGDCVPAGALHSDELFNAVSGNPVPKYVDADAERAYEAVGDYVPGDRSTDNGAYLVDMLNYWRKKGLPSTGNKLGAFVSVDPTNATQVKTSIWEFGVAYVGFALPISAQNQVHWDVPKGGTRGDGAPGSWGGHCVPAASYDRKYVALLTWGTVILCTWAFFGTYCDEAYAIVSPDQLKGGKSNLGLDYSKLNTDLSNL